METIKKNLLSWEFWVSVAIVSIVAGWAFASWIWPQIMKAKAKATAALIGLGILFMSFQAGAAPVQAEAPLIHIVPGAPPHTMLAAASPDTGLMGLAFALCAVVGVSIGAGILAKRMKAATVIVALVLGCGVWSIFAADYVENKITSLILYAGRGVDATNGYIRMVSPSGTNWARTKTNGETEYFNPAGLFTGFTGLTRISNWSLAATQVWVDGRLVMTNAPAIAPTTW